jgi:hypothetical protein
MVQNGVKITCRSFRTREGWEYDAVVLIMLDGATAVLCPFAQSEGKKCHKTQERCPYKRGV